MIAFHLEQETLELMNDEIELDGREAISAMFTKTKESTELVGKLLSSGF